MINAFPFLVQIVSIEPAAGSGPNFKMAVACRWPWTRLRPQELSPLQTFAWLAAAMEDKEVNFDEDALLLVTPFPRIEVTRCGPWSLRDEEPGRGRPLGGR